MPSIGARHGPKGRQTGELGWEWCEEKRGEPENSLSKMRQDGRPGPTFIMTSFLLIRAWSPCSNGTGGWVLRVRITLHHLASPRMEE